MSLEYLTIEIKGNIKDISGIIKQTKEFEKKLRTYYDNMHIIIMIDVINTIDTIDTICSTTHNINIKKKQQPSFIIILLLSYLLLLILGILLLLII